MRRALDDSPDPIVAAPVLSPDELRAIATEVLELASGEMTNVWLDHLATGITRVARGRVRLSRSGDRVQMLIRTRFGRRIPVELTVSQIDRTSLRQAVAYVDRVAREQTGDPIETVMPITPRRYGPNTTWHESTTSAFSDARHAAVRPLIEPVINAGLTAAAFVGVAVHSRGYADSQGLMAAAQETDSELTVTAWNANGKGSGWAGQAARDWNMVRPDEIARDAIRLTRLAANPVVFEPGRRTVILDRPAVAQIVAGMGKFFAARSALSGGPLFDRTIGRVRLGQRVFDPRLTLRSDPNDPDGGYIPFNDRAYPQVAMTWVGDGAILKNLAYDPEFAASLSIAPSNDAPESLRLESVSHGTTTVDEMIASCAEGIYVNRFAQLAELDPDSGAVTGVTNGGCFLVRHGKIEKAIKDLRFVESPWFFLNRVEAIGVAQRASLGYSPWYRTWPIAPTIVPPVMVRDFNFVGLADNV